MPALMSSLSNNRAGLLRALRLALVVSLAVAFVGALALRYEYRRYSRVVDRRLAHSVAFAPQVRLQPASHRGRSGQRSLALVAAGMHSKRRVPDFDALPPELVQAVVSIEDRRFFEHSGVNYWRTAECAVQDTLTFHAGCGGSTLTQQLARASFLSQQKTLRRKVAEMLIARRLEQRLNKQQIFAIYARQINLGQHGSEPVKGFRQASQVYFGKNLNQLDLPQCALLAGMIQRPNFYNPYRHPERATARRNVVLEAMVSTGAISRAQADAAKGEPLDLAALSPDDTGADTEFSVLG